MRWLDRMAIKVRMLLGRGGAGAELDEELRFHIERQTAENIAAGMSPDEARFAALRAFGNPALLREQTRATWSWGGLESFLRDLRIGMRTLRRTPGFTVIAILVMALGIGANVALFTVVRGVLLRPLPFKDPNRLLMLYERDSAGNFPFDMVAAGVYAAWNRGNSTFSSMALVNEGRADLSGSNGDLPETLDSAEVSWSLFSTLGVRPVLGRDFTAADDNRAANSTVILSWGLWKRRFGGNPAILNQTIYLDARPYTVIGVMPAWFEFPASTTQLWITANHYMPQEVMEALDDHMFRVVGRRKPDVTQPQAIADLAVISRRLHNAHLNNPFIYDAAAGRSLLEHMVGDIERPLYTLLAATACLLLIACLNVANLLVARAVARRRELAIRTALGGGRIRLLREHLMESLLLSIAGGAAGLALAYAAVVWLVRTRRDMARIESVHIDGIVAAFTVGVIVLCALFSGLISALNAGDKRILAALHQTSQSHRAGSTRARLRKALLAAEVGLTVVLLVAAVLFLRSYQRLRSTDVGCPTNNILTMRIVLPGARYKTPGAAPAGFFERLLQRVRALPGVEAAGFATVVPGQGWSSDWGFTIVGHPPLPQGKGLDALDRWADPGYFQAMGIPILRGHTFDPGQTFDHADEAVVSQSFAQHFFPREDPIGKHLRIGPMDGWVVTIVGIVSDVRYSQGEPPERTMYFPLFAGKSSNGTLVIRSSRDVEQLALPVQHVIQQMDPDLPVSDVLTMNQMLGKSALDQSFDTTLLTGFAALSLTLAAVGLFGVLSYLVAQRTSEIGIRIALGARRDRVLGLMLADGLRPALLGLVLGLAASTGATRLIRSMLYETRPLDPAVFAAVAAALLLVAVLACLFPAWRASRLDPIRALRNE